MICSLAAERKGTLKEGRAFSLCVEASNAIAKKGRTPQNENISQENPSRFLGRGCDEALFSEKKGFSVNRGERNSVNQGLGKDFYRKGNSVKRFGPFTEPPDSEN